MCTILGGGLWRCPAPVTAACILPGNMGSGACLYCLVTVEAVPTHEFPSRAALYLSAGDAGGDGWGNALVGIEFVIDIVAHGAKRTLLPWRRLPPLLLLLAETGWAEDDMVFNLVSVLCVL